MHTYTVVFSDNNSSGTIILSVEAENENLAVEVADEELKDIVLYPEGWAWIETEIEEA